MSPEVYAARREALFETLQAIIKEVKRGQAADRELLRDLVGTYGTLKYAIENN